MTDLSKDYIRMPDVFSIYRWKCWLWMTHDEHLWSAVSATCTCDSIRFYEWLETAYSISCALPVMGDFLNTPDSAGVYGLTKHAVRQIYYWWKLTDFNKENAELTVTLTTPDYVNRNGRETETVSRRPIVYHWKNGPLPNSLRALFLYSNSLSIR